ncbi:dolichyl-diphosphooligosaccharide--protein glycosyltransferase subunit STT3A [Platysternon megacephalum]|uniref:Dolichyl-diphosphooligosaccharide--protein glycosyltransferase subunit STT3A n=1 Tax=Platysternon megacephalum TaxID=55544 RepID=A0A4D9E9W2_9SAUR|nr:dolichyl-diphosphooligosaccharide--protein glycosyltransferase subunit STT3A [Platysternon megacephalum]
MATVLSRALKLPGKKSPDLGEYDPLTQADSDESEDDLVLNLQKNGGVKNGKSTLEEVQDPDSEVEVEVTKQRLSESAPDGYPAEATGSLEQKAASSLMPYLRTAVFLLTMVISMILVLVCAFLIPCPPRDLHNTWNRNLGQEAGVSRPSVTVMALSGMNGSTLWSSHIPEETRSVQCKGLTLTAPAEPVCLVTGTSKFLSLLQASSGRKTIWTLNPAHLPSGTLAAPAVMLPDLDGDKVGDLVVLAIGETQRPRLFSCFCLITIHLQVVPASCALRTVIQQVRISIFALPVTYLLGNVQAVALRDLFAQARNRDSFPPVLQREEPEWEKRRSVNLSELIDIYSGGVEFLQMVTASDTNCSDLLITTKHNLTLLRGEDLEPRWNLELQDIHSQPAPGYFNADQTLDFMVQAQSNDNVKKMLVVDGKSGLPVWSYDLPCHMQESDALSVMTLEKKSVFLFWADEMQPALQNLEPGPRNKRPGLHHLYLLHPTFPTLLLDLTNVTDTVTASAIGINDLQKDAFYITMTTSLTSENQPGLLLVSKLGLRWAMLTQSRMVPLMESTPKISRGEVRRVLSRLKFIDFPHKF